MSLRLSRYFRRQPPSPTISLKVVRHRNVTYYVIFLYLIALMKTFSRTRCSSQMERVLWCHKGMFGKLRSSTFRIWHDDFLKEYVVFSFEVWNLKVEDLHCIVPNILRTLMRFRGKFLTISKFLISLKVDYSSHHSLIHCKKTTVGKLTLPSIEWNNNKSFENIS